MKSRARGSVSSSGPVGPVSLRVFVPLRSPRRASLRSYSSTPSTSASSSCTACSTAARTCWWIRTPRENFSSCTSFSFLIALPTACSSGRRLGRRRVGGFPTGRMRHFHFPHHPGRDLGRAAFFLSCNGWCAPIESERDRAVGLEGRFTYTPRRDGSSPRVEREGHLS